MHGIRVYCLILAPVIAGFCVSCSGTGNNTGNDSNKAAPAATTAPTSTPGKTAPTPSAAASPSGGVIDIISTPPGASVMLIRQDEGSSGMPERKGATPVTITGVAPGKYSITLEKTGFKYFQKDIEVKENKTVKIAASLKRG